MLDLEAVRARLRKAKAGDLRAADELRKDTDMLVAQVERLAMCLKAVEALSTDQAAKNDATVALWGWP